MNAPDIADQAPESTLEASRARALETCGGCAAGTPWVTSYGSDTGFVDCEHLPVGHRINARSTCALTPSKWVVLDAKRLAQRGIEHAVAAADRAAPGWSDRALEFIRLWALDHQRLRFIGHELVRASIAAGVSQPPNAKAWGGPIQRAARAGHIVKVGTDEDPNRHGNPVPLWEAQ